MINITDFTAANQTLADLGISVLGNENEALNVTVVKHILSFPEAVFYSYCIFMSAILLHEIGHYLVLRRHSPTTEIKIYMRAWIPHIQTGVQADYDPLKPGDKVQVYVAGIALGLLPIIIGAFIHPLYVVLLGPYIVGLLPDLKLIKQYWGKE